MWVCSYRTATTLDSRDESLTGFVQQSRLEPSPEVACADKVGEVTSQLIVVVVVEAFEGRGLDRAGHPLNLAIRPGMLDPGQPMVDLMLAADPVADVLEGMNVPVVVGELAAVIGQHDVDAVRHSSGQVACDNAVATFPAFWCNST